MSEPLSSLFKTLTHGVYVVGVSDGNNDNAFTAAWVMQTSFNPPMLAIAINPNHSSYQLLNDGKCCTVNVLSEEQSELAKHFGTRVDNKMARSTWYKARTGAPVLADALVYFDCQVSHITHAGDHNVVICRIVEVKRLKQGNPLLYIQTGDMDGSSQLFPPQLNHS